MNYSLGLFTFKSKKPVLYINNSEFINIFNYYSFADEIFLRNFFDNNFLLFSVEKFLSFENEILNEILFVKIYKNYKQLAELTKKIIKLLNYCRKTKNKKLEWRIY